MRQLFIGLIAEGTTDIRFLKNVISKSVQDLSWYCDSQIEIFPIQEIKASGSSFVEKMLDASRNAKGFSALCIHTDADSRAINDVIKNKFSDLFSALRDMPEDQYCKFIIPTIPVQMIESWMLADKELLKQLINAANSSDAELGLERPPESYADPKAAIETAIRKALSTKPKKRRNQIVIADLYELLGNRLSIDKLRSIPSFRQFEEYVKHVFKSIGLMR